MKVSVITPVFNQGQFIEETISSILAQDYPDIEHIVLDDGSTDSTAEVVRPFMDRLTYLRHENIGESRTVNKGYGLTTGAIVGVVNADDPLFSTDAISRIVSCFTDNPDTLAVYPDWVSIDENGEILDRIEVPDYTIETMLRGFDVRLGPGMFIRRSALEKIGYRNESLKYTGDLDVSFRLALAGEITHVSAYLATHRVHKAAASSVAKGDVMAGEVVRLAKSSLESASVPPALLADRNKILSYAHLVGTHYAKPFSAGYLKHVVAALMLDPALFRDLFVGGPRTGFVKCFGLLQSLRRTLFRLLR